MSAAGTDASPLDVLVLGSGVAGLSAAVRAAGVEGLSAGVLTKADLAQSATRWAQGGIAAVLGGDEDSTDLHLADTLGAGAGLCDTDAVRVLVDEGPARVNDLIAMGAVFDRYPEGGLARAREGGHSMARILHAGGAATGAEIERALVEAVRQTAAAIWEGWFALDLVVEDGRCVGVTVLDPAGRVSEIRATHLVLATGGAGQMFAVTTNPTQATGDAVAMALRAGAAVADVEFMQFHPTALHHPAMPRPLLSEALRGHGALLRDADGERFVDELLPRDVVARAMTARMLDQGVDHLWLDATGLERFDERFPTIAASVRQVGLDPAADWLPIAPAAHYLSGGVVTDLCGASSIPGLWACGEAACTGVHGANRLASNSLLEGMVFAPRVVEAILAGTDAPQPTGAMRAVLDGSAGPDVIGGRPLALELPGGAGGGADDVGGPANPAKERDRLQRAMTHGAGVLRSSESLAATAEVVAGVLSDLSDRPPTPEVAELRNVATAAWALLRAAAARTESRGAHTRTDHPDTRPEWRCRLVFGGAR
ncbi:MAG TPA: FAD-binding protein [Acidimicrobiales bacterium]|nr:FAD-binding protein [Acidimicrobiales bacterium]